jgi:hypothetical protein
MKPESVLMAAMQLLVARTDTSKMSDFSYPVKNNRMKDCVMKECAEDAWKLAREVHATLSNFSET